MGPKPLTNAGKGHILSLREEKATIIEICRWSQHGKTTIKRFLAAVYHLPPNQVLAHKTHLGAKRKTSQGTLIDSWWLPWKKANVCLTARQLKEMYRAAQEHIREDSVKLSAKGPKIPSHTAVLKPLLTDRMKKKRLHFVKEHKHWSVDQWMEIMWSDESTFLPLCQGSPPILLQPLPQAIYSTNSETQSFYHGVGML